ncbi:MAG: HlyD family secretion protein [Planctomycetota bacterium]
MGPPSWSVERLHTWRGWRAIQFLLWVIAAGVLLFLVRVHNARMTAIGIVDRDALITLASPVAGRVIALPHQIGERVQAGTVLVRLEDRDLVQRLRMLEERLANVDALQSRHAAAAVSLQTDLAGDQLDRVRASENIAAWEVDLAELRDRRMEVLQDQSAVQAELSVVQTEVARQRQLAEASLVPTTERVALEQRQAELQARLAAYPDRLTALQASIMQLQEERARLEGILATGDQPAARDAALGLLETQRIALVRDELLAERDDLLIEQEQRHLRAPVNGVITSLAVSAQSSVAADQMVVGMRGDDRRTVTAWFDEGQSRRIQRQDQVALVPVDGGEPVLGTVRSVGPAVVLVDPSVIRDTRAPVQRGRPVTIDCAEGNLLPGATVYIQDLATGWW